MKIPEFASKQERFEFMVANKSKLITAKKFELKKADGIIFSPVYSIEGTGKEASYKAIDNPAEFDGNKIAVDVVINTTNIMDSHDDVHIKGIWNKSLKEQKNLFLLQEHQMKFDMIISDDVKAIVKDFTWKELGLNAEGDTQALMFKALIEKEDHTEFMFKQYLKGKVKNHSVGMRYVKLALAIDNKDFKEEKEVFDKYIEQIVNKDAVTEQGFFWAVTQAKVIEGSAVPIGSNVMTPTHDVNAKKPLEDTSKIIPEPLESTHRQVIKHFKL